MYLYIMILSCILVTRHKHTRSIFSAITSRQIFLLLYNRASVSLYNILFMLTRNKYHQHSLQADVSLSIAVFFCFFYFLELPNCVHILKKSRKAVAIKYLLSGHSE
jgi:hypothetical protein